MTTEGQIKSASIWNFARSRCPLTRVFGEKGNKELTWLFNNIIANYRGRDYGDRDIRGGFRQHPTTVVQLEVENVWKMIHLTLRFKAFSVRGLYPFISTSPCRLQPPPPSPFPPPTFSYSSSAFTIDEKHFCPLDHKITEGQISVSFWIFAWSRCPLTRVHK